MKVYFRKTKWAKHSQTLQSARREWGDLRGKLLRRRLDELDAAPSLETLRYLPGVGCHELKGDRKGQLAVNLDQPWRLILEPANEPVPRKDDGGLDWAKITEITVSDILDYHG